MTASEKERIAQLCQQIHRHSTDPAWRPGQAEASHQLAGIRQVLAILGYDALGNEDGYEIRPRRQNP